MTVKQFRKMDTRELGHPVKRKVRTTSTATNLKLQQNWYPRCNEKPRYKNHLRDAIDLHSTGRRCTTQFNNVIKKITEIPNIKLKDWEKVLEKHLREKGQDQEQDQEQDQNSRQARAYQFDKQIWYSTVLCQET